MERPDEQKPQTITFPNGTTFVGGASGQQASALAQLIVDCNNNVKEYKHRTKLSASTLQYQRLINFFDYLPVCLTGAKSFSS